MMLRVEKKKSHWINVSIGLPHIQNNIENKINSKFEVNTIYLRNDADTKLPTVRTVFTMIILACDIFVFLLKLSLKNNIRNKKLPIILSSRRKRAIQYFDAYSLALDFNRNCLILSMLLTRKHISLTKCWKFKIILFGSFQIIIFIRVNTKVCSV